ncbi:MAG: hypothetical protein K0Q92_650 [Steroidobacteraceae bacterium]|jgi:hypothetical protein|nr:hypothetical protein [Steroidobacteraceae bacterium]
MSNEKRERYDFSRLTPRQEELLTFGGWILDDAKAGRVQPSKRTVAKLIERGLVETSVVKERMWDVTQYHVPVDVHIAWCDHCSRQLFPEVA